MPPLDSARPSSTSSSSSGASESGKASSDRSSSSASAASFDQAVEQQRTAARPQGQPSPGQSSPNAANTNTPPPGQDTPAGTRPGTGQPPGASAGGTPPGTGQPPTAQPNGNAVTPAGQSTQTGTPAGTSEGGVASAASDNTVGPKGPSQGVVENVGGTGRAAFDPQASIGRLNSDGDQTKMSLLVEPSVTVSTPELPVASVGANFNYGFEVTVRQVGDAPGAGGTAAPGTVPNAPGTATPGSDPNVAPGSKTPQYEVIFDKRMQAALTAAIRPPKDSVLVAGGELSLQTADRVVMRFDTKEDATRAVEALRQVAAAETVRDAAAAIPGPLPGASGVPNNPAGNPLNGASDGGTAPAPGTERPGPSQAGNGPGGPLNPNNAPEIAGEVLARRLEPSEADKQFLTDHISGYEQVLTGQAFARADLMLGDTLKVGGGLHGTAADRIIRRVDLPQGDNPGRITYSAEGQVALTGRERINVNTLAAPDINGHVINMQDIADVRGRVSVSYDVPASQFNGQGQPFPDADILTSGQWKHPDEIQATLQVNGRAQPLTDVSRSDQAQVIVQASLKNPDEHAAQVLGSLARGDFTDLRSALGAVPADTSVLARTQFVERDGSRFRADGGVDVPGVGGAHVTFVGEFGNDDVVARSDRRWTGAPPATETPPVETPPPQQGTPGQVVITPHDGVNVRPAPGTADPRTGVLQHGTFAQPTGQRATDATGREWIEVRSTDVADKPIQGWVAAEYTAPHPAGAMDATGRINPELERAGYREVAVKPGDTIWDISRREKTDFQETVALNRDHIIDPNMIFPGDTVYLPGPTNPPAPPTPPATTAPPATTPPGSSSGSPPDGGSTGGSSGPGGSPGNAPSGPGGSSGSGGSSGTNPPGGSSSGGAPPTGSPSTRPPGGSSSGSPPPGRSSTATPPGSPAPGGSSGTTPPGSPTPGGPPAGGASGTTPPGTTPPGGASSGGSPPGGTTAPPTTGGTAPGSVPLADRPNLDGVLRDYQVQADPGGMVNHAPAFGLFGSREMTKTESDMLNGLFPPWRQNDVKDIHSTATDMAAARYPDHPVPAGTPANRANEWQGNDGHRDAMRHALGSAMLARDFGGDWATRFTTAHEGLPEADQNADREAMDLYNNSVGIRIARENPGASNEELAAKVQEAMDRGELVVIDGNHELAWSDQVPVGQHGLADDPGVPGARTVSNGAS